MVVSILFICRYIAVCLCDMSQTIIVMKMTRHTTIENKIFTWQGIFTSFGMPCPGSLI